MALVRRNARAGCSRLRCGSAPLCSGSYGGPNDAASRSTRRPGCDRRTRARCSNQGERPAIRSGRVNGPIFFVAATAFVSASATLGVSMLRLPSRVDVALAWALVLTTTIARAADALPSWNDGKTKQSIVDFVKRATTKGGKDFVPQPPFKFIEEHSSGSQPCISE